MTRWWLMLALVAGCTRVGTGNEALSEPPSGVAPIATTTPPAKTPAKVATRIELTAVTLADDCRGAPSSKAKSATDVSARGAAVRRCEQTSMQLAIVAADASRIVVKSVELFDDRGRSIGTLAASKPTRWSDAKAIYEPWDEMVGAGQTLNVSYVLAQPRWDAVPDRWNRTFTLKAVLSVGGIDQRAQKDVAISAPTSLPPNVKT